MKKTENMIFILCSIIGFLISCLFFLVCLVYFLSCCNNPDLETQTAKSDKSLDSYIEDTKAEEEYQVLLNNIKQSGTHTRFGWSNNPVPGTDNVTTEEIMKQQGRSINTYENENN